MDESLKARLIGATVLVVVAVLLVPELLSGRKARGPAVEEAESSPGSRKFTIELGPTGSAGAELSPARSAPAPTTASGAPPVPKSPESGPVAAAATPSAADDMTVVATLPAPGPGAPAGAAAGAAVTATVPPPGATGSVVATGDGGWTVQVGAFGTPESAGRVVHELGAAGFEARVDPVTRGGRTLHRVRVGHESDKAAAERLAQRLQARGLPGTVVTDD